MNLSGFSRAMWQLLFALILVIWKGWKLVLCLMAFVFVGYLPMFLTSRRGVYWTVQVCLYGAMSVSLFLVCRRFIFTSMRRRRIYRKIWKRFCLIHGFGVLHNKKIVAPKLVRIESEAWADWLYVRMLPGQVPEQYEHVRDAMAHSLGVERVLTWSDEPGRVVIRVQIRKPEPVYHWVNDTEATVSYR